MSRISEETVREIRERSDIVEVISGYLQLRRSGTNYLGLCPFHQEKTPSFNVNAPRQIFHCFGCGVGGNVFTFVMRMEGLTFPEAVKRLGEKAGITVEETPVTPIDRQRRDQRERLVFATEAVMDEAVRQIASSTFQVMTRRSVELCLPHWPAVGFHCAVSGQALSPSTWASALRR